MELYDLLDHPIAYHRCLRTLVGSADAALMLSQALYWTRRTTLADRWFYKSRKEWEDETGLSRSEQDCARKRLRATGFWHEKLSGIPATVHFRVDCGILQQRLLAVPHTDAGTRNRESGIAQTCSQDSANITSSETTSEITSEITVEREPAVERKLLAKAARAHQWPPGFALNASLFNYASSKGLAHIEDQFEAFENYHRSKGSKFLDWYRAWYTWVAKAIEWGKNGNGQTRTESFAERQSRRGAEAIQSVLGRYEAPSGDLPRALPPTDD